MCVMADVERVGIRELRQNLSVYVKHVRERGRAYEVTEHGRPVARLLPLADAPNTTLQQLLADGQATAPGRPWSTVPPPLPARRGKRLSKVLEEMRDAEPW